jgi:hypothetical protein
VTFSSFKQKGPGPERAWGLLLSPYATAPKKTGGGALRHDAEKQNQKAKTKADPPPHAGKLTLLAQHASRFGMTSCDDCKR